MSTTTALLLSVVPPGLLPTPDTMEHISIANAWVEGSGFVNPIQWTFALDHGPPVSGGASRPLLLTLLIAAPLALGVPLDSLTLLHALFAGLTIGAVFLLARAFLGMPAAIGLALLCATNDSFVAAAVFVNTEVVGVLGFMAVIAAAPLSVASRRAAFFCAVITLLAWMARPNLGPMVLAVAVAGVIELGPRRAIRSQSLWIYVASFAGLVLAAQLLSVLLTGGALGSGYNFEVLDQEGAWAYGAERLGTLAFLGENWDAVVAVWSVRLRQAWEGLFSLRPFRAVGWFAPISIALVLLLAKRGGVSLRTSAFAALGLTLLVVLNHAAFVYRFYLFPAIAGWICMLWVATLGADALGAQLRERGHDARVAAAAALLPLVLASGLAVAGGAWFLPGGAWFVEAAVAARALADESDTTRSHRMNPEICAALKPNAIVASADPWDLHFECGNAAMKFPSNATDPDVWKQVLEERSPSYILIRRIYVPEILPVLDEFARVAVLRGVVVFERRETDHFRPWRAPPPPACAGLAGRAEHSCLAKRGRLPRQ